MHGRKKGPGRQRAGADWSCLRALQHWRQQERKWIHEGGTGFMYRHLHLPIRGYPSQKAYIPVDMPPAKPRPSPRARRRVTPTIAASAREMPIGARHTCPDISISQAMSRESYAVTLTHITTHLHAHALAHIPFPTPPHTHLGKRVHGFLAPSFYAVQNAQPNICIYFCPGVSAKCRLTHHHSRHSAMTPTYPSFVHGCYQHHRRHSAMTHTHPFGTQVLLGMSPSVIDRQPSADSLNITAGTQL
eukprot:1158254-Pelagomonas_calceolata.AAC.1